jgi:hypothetical protein
MDPRSILDVISVLDDMRSEGIITSYAVGGAFAAILYEEPISTIDLDIFFFLKKRSDSPILSLTEIYDYAKSQGFSFDSEFINIHGWLVQFVEASHDPLWSEAVVHAMGLRIDVVEVPVIQREYLMAMWLVAGRPKDYQKIAMFWESRKMDKKKFDSLIERFDLRVKWEKEKWRFSDE